MWESGHETAVVLCSCGCGRKDLADYSRLPLPRRRSDLTIAETDIT